MKKLKKIFKKTKIKSIVLNLLLIFTLLFNNLFYIFAQESTSSAIISPSESPSSTSEPTSEPPPGPFEEPSPTQTPTLPSSPTTIPGETSLQDISPTLDPTSGPTITPNILTTPSPQFSATIRTPIKSYLISKSHLTGGQSLAVGVLNAKDVELKTALFRNDEEINMDILKKSVGEKIIIIVDPPVSFTPGKYTLKITDPSAHTEEQNFWWGVLAVNTEKSVYSPGEEANFSFAVLDQEGRKLCDAKLNLKIKNEQQSVSDELSTENGKIKNTNQCLNKNTNSESDYTAKYKAGPSGIYHLELSATAKNGTYTIIDSFEVKEDVPFIVDRQDFPTRLNASDDTEVGVKITAVQDFVGSIVEAVPDVINVASSSATPYNWIASGVSKTDDFMTGADSPLIIRYPFEGDYPVTLKFGEDVKDDEEKSLYEKYGLAGHDGVDFALPEATPVLAADDGEVILAGRGAYGVTVVLQHSWGKSYYGHLQGTGHNLGDKVLKGDKIGLSGKTGLATGPHLHFGIKFSKNDMKNGYYGKVDPWPYLTGSSIIPGFSVRLIGWNVSLKKGETKDLRYRIDAPDISPQFYLFGPLRFYERSTESEPATLDSPFVLGLSTKINSKPLFKEERQWQIAVAAVESPPSSPPEVLAQQSDSPKTEKSVIHKGKPVNTNLKDNSVKDDGKLFRWKVNLPNGTTFSFGQQETGGIKPVIKVKNKIGWFVEFSPIGADYVKPKVDGNQIEWEIAPRITARYTALKDRIKADYIVKDKQSFVNNKLDFLIQYNDEFSGEGEESDKGLKQGKGFLTPILTHDGEIDWLGENNWTYFTFPKPTVKDSAQAELDASFEIKKTGKGSSVLSINLPKNQADSAIYPITIDPVTLDSAATAVATAYGNARQIIRDPYGNLIALCDCGTGDDNVYYKNWNAVSWTDAAVDLDGGAGSSQVISGDLDGQANNESLHTAFINSTDADVSYVKVTISRAADNTISSMSEGSVFDLDTAHGARPSLIVANKSEGGGKEKIAVAWASNSGSGNPKNGEIRFAQCDVADGCDAAAEWKNASEAENFSGSCTATAGVPNGRDCAGGADSLFNVASHTTHHGVLTQVPGRPARTPKSAKVFDGASSTYTDLSEAIDDNTATDTGTKLNGLATNDYLYIADDIPFSRLVVDIETGNSTGSLSTREYCSANSDITTSCDTWTALSNYIDNTSSASSHTEDGSILFDEPSNWVKSTENTVQGYWVRFQPGVNFASSTPSVDEYEVTDRHSHDLLIVGDNTSLTPAYVIWDFIGQAGWENIIGNTTAPAPWREGVDGIIDANSANWSVATNFPLTISPDHINNALYLAYYICLGASCGTTSVLTVKTVKNNEDLLDTGGTATWSNTSFPSVSEASDVVLSLTSDQNDIYLFHILDPGTNALVYRKCQPNGGGTRDICDNASDWSSAATLDNDTTISHPQAIVSKAFGDTVAIDVIYTDTTDLDLRYERHYVNMADKTIVVAASGDDARHTDCTTGTDSQNIDANITQVGHRDDFCGASNDSEESAGFRFPAVAVSQGSAISSAYFDFRVSSRNGSTAVDFTVYGEDVDDSAAFTLVSNCSGDTNCVANRTRTTISSAQSINFAGDTSSGNSYRIDVTDMVQEIICRGAANSQPCVGNYNGSGTWASGNDLAILLISTEGGAVNNLVSLQTFDATGDVMLDPTLQINLGNTNKRYSMGVLKAPTTAADLDHPMETEEFSGVNTDDTLFASVSASLVPSASSSAVPIFQFKANNTNNNNTDDMTVSAIVKSSIPAKSYGGGHYAGKQICLQVYDTSSGWATNGTCNTTSVADTDITLSGSLISPATTKYFQGDGGGSCSGSDCWTAWRIYQDAAPEANQILYVDYFTISFSSSGPTTDQQLHHGNWFSGGVEQSFTF